MGHAWCKEKSSKAQDSKSPIDRVFVRCAHRIYPSLKEEGSVLGGAGTTQRITSSEIGHAASGAGAAGPAAPRAGKLQRGHSIDSVDRPFHPSDWVDVNLEVPCTPRYSLVQPRRATDRGPGEEQEAPVPPPRRRRRRSRSQRTADAADDESEPEPELLTSSARCSPNATLGSGDGPSNSDDEFVEIEKSLLREQVSEESAELRNHSTTSLPNVVEPHRSGTPVATKAHEDDDKEADGVAKRPPRQKMSSLPRDVSLFEPQAGEKPGESPERTSTPTSTSARRRSVSSHEEDLREDCSGGNSIFKIDTSREEGKDVVDDDDDTHFDGKTSTPVKAGVSTAPVDEDKAVFSAQSLDDAFESFNNQHLSRSSKSRDSSSEEGAVAVPVAQDVDRPARSEDDGGYESKSSTQMFLEFERSSAALESEEPSSGISRDATLALDDSTRLVNLMDDELPGLVVIQRTISEESLPHEMLVEELDEEQQEPRSKEQSSGQEEESSGTPPPSPERGNRETSSASVNGFVEVSREPGSTTGLEAGLADIAEKRDEPQIVAVERLLPFEDIAELEEPVGLPALERTKPFAEPAALAQHEYNVDEPPEKPKRVERPGLPTEEPVIEEPLIVPTPPRRRNRSKSSLNSPAEPEALHTYASRDRLI